MWPLEEDSWYFLYWTVLKQRMCIRNSRRFSLIEVISVNLTFNNRKDDLKTTEQTSSVTIHFNHLKYLYKLYIRSIGFSRPFNVVECTVTLQKLVKTLCFKLSYKNNRCKKQVVLQKQQVQQAQNNYLAPTSWNLENKVLEWLKPNSKVIHTIYKVSSWMNINKGSFL